MIKVCARKTVVFTMLAFSLSVITSSVFANNEIVGIWKTESSDRGYLHVDVTICEDKICGTIVNAFNTSDELIDDYEHVGKPIIWDMAVRGENSWNKGKIWDPSSDKTYKSKMSVSGNVLSVSGCVAFFCKALDWLRIE